MITTHAQRWYRRRESYRPVTEASIGSLEHEVAEIPDDTTAKAFVLEHHYSGSYVSAKRRFGLYCGKAKVDPETGDPRGHLVGVAVFSTPVNMLSLDPAPGDKDTRAELGRLVLIDDVPANGESWFLARCFELLRAEGFSGIVSFSDPVARTDVGGHRVHPGHIGTIYQATNGVYLGTSKPETRLLLPDGTMLPNRLLTKIRKGERGWRYGVERLEQHGAVPLRAGEDATAWLRRVLPVITRPLRHTGNHKYVWDLERRGKRARLPPSKPYPKLALGQLGMFAE